MNNNVPINVANVIKNDNTSFLLLNNEFRNATYLTGFKLYGAVSGSITINVRIISFIRIY